MITHIPLKSTPNQRLSIELDGQNVEIVLNTRFNQQLYMSIQVNGQIITHNRLCLNGALLNGVDYLPMVGNFIFIDTQGSSAPHFSELGRRYRLVWIN